MTVTILPGYSWAQGELDLAESPAAVVARGDGWVDEVLIDNVLAGRPGYHKRLTEQERIAAVWVALGRRMKQDRLAAVLHVSGSRLAVLMGKARAWSGGGAEDAASLTRSW